MSKLVWLLCFCMVYQLNFAAPIPSGNQPETITVTDSIYRKAKLHLFNLDPHVFFQAYKGYQYLLDKGLLNNPQYLTICDYSKSSNEKRFYVIDLFNCTLKYWCEVGHGKNSGGEFATSFSNLPESNKSSLGFMITGETYYGFAGFSLRLDGIEKTINDNVRKRAIVIHGSFNTTPEVKQKRGYTGRSYGCPAIPYGIHYKVIDDIKNGSCFFAYYPNTAYFKNSIIANAQFEWPVLVSKDQAQTSNKNNYSTVKLK